MSVTPRAITPFRDAGEFLFGDYFKEDAIKFAWDLITKDFGIPKARLLATVYADDDDAFVPVEENRRILRRPHHPHSDVGEFLVDGRYRPLRPVF
ncbi:MAG: alanine--tRNA ligase-related protein [Rhizomicrobium sp.]